jgi:negative regulator of flagellin synthesis FlgM
MSYTNGVGALQQGLSSITPAATPATESANTQNQSTAPVAKEGRVDHADQTNLSSASGVIAQALSGSDVRTNKVDALQQAIASGSYSVASSDVADKMIQSLLE